MELERVQNRQVEANDFLLEFPEEQKQNPRLAEHLIRWGKMFLILL